ncbi:hypothetical protein SLS54_006977 [Diplodia seriata]
MPRQHPVEDKQGDAVMPLKHPVEDKQGDAVMPLQNPVAPTQQHTPKDKQGDAVMPRQHPVEDKQGDAVMPLKHPHTPKDKQGDAVMPRQHPVEDKQGDAVMPLKHPVTPTQQHPVENNQGHAVMPLKHPVTPTQQHPVENNQGDAVMPLKHPVTPTQQHPVENNQGHAVMPRQHPVENNQGGEHTPKDNQGHAVMPRQHPVENNQGGEHTPKDNQGHAVMPQQKVSVISASQNGPMEGPGTNTLDPRLVDPRLLYPDLLIVTDHELAAMEEDDRDITKASTEGSSMSAATPTLSSSKGSSSGFIPMTVLSRPKKRKQQTSDTTKASTEGSSMTVLSEPKRKKTTIPGTRSITQYFTAPEARQSNASESIKTSEATQALKSNEIRSMAANAQGSHELFGARVHNPTAPQNINSVASNAVTPQVPVTDPILTMFPTPDLSMEGALLTLDSVGKLLYNIRNAAFSRSDPRRGARLEFELSNNTIQSVARLGDRIDFVSMLSLLFAFIQPSYFDPKLKKSRNSLRLRYTEVLKTQTPSVTPTVNGYFRIPVSRAKTIARGWGIEGLLQPLFDAL